MPVAPNTAAAAALLLLLLPAGCAPPAKQACQRYDALSLHRGNDFSGRFDWKSAALLDLPMERIEVSMSVVRPMKGQVELVHVLGDKESDHWTLTLPDYNLAPVSLCTIAMPGVAPNCGASLQNAPFSPHGYYYLRAGGNSVLEAGISFFVCD